MSNHEVTTYRYLRLAMVLLVVALFASVVHEVVAQRGDCLQTSLSEYWYTPAQAVVVGTLVAIGVCMVALKGNTPGEDFALNLAGMLAPVVALVPTPGPGGCATVRVDAAERAAATANNVTVLAVAGVLALGVAVWLAWRDLRPRSMLAYAATAVVLGGFYGWFRLGRGSFVEHAHTAAALALFAFIVAVVVLNARGFAAQRSGRFANRYLVIAALMVGTLVVLGGAALLTDWSHAVLWLETVLIALFAVFWLLQTVELWHAGVRHAGVGGRHANRD